MFRVDGLSVRDDLRLCPGGQEEKDDDTDGWNEEEEIEGPDKPEIRVQDECNDREAKVVAGDDGVAEEVSNEETPAAVLGSELTTHGDEDAESDDLQDGGKEQTEE